MLTAILLISGLICFILFFKAIDFFEKVVFHLLAVVMRIQPFKFLTANCFA